MRRFIMLMRHGEPIRPGKEPGEDKRLSKDGYEEVAGVAERLAETLTELPDEDAYRIRVGEIWSGEKPAVGATARSLSKELASVNKISNGATIHKAELNPEIFCPYKNKKAHERLLKDLKSRLETLLKDESGDNAIVVVGHQPLLSWMAYQLVGKVVPITRAELVCIGKDEGIRTRGGRWSLLWTISPGEEKIIEDLRNKIKSKMDVAKILGPFITLILGILLKLLFDSFKSSATVPTLTRGFICASAVSFFISAWLYFAAICAYDQLLMPRRFWGDKKPPPEAPKRPKWLVWRPPSSAAWVLYQNMTRTWKFIFMPATYAIGVGILFLVFAVFQPCHLTEIVPSIIGVCVIVGLLVLYYWRARPRLGAED